MAEGTNPEDNLSKVWEEIRRIAKAVERLEGRFPTQVRSNEAHSTKEAAKLLGISERTLRRHASLGHIRPIRIGRRTTYTRQSLEVFQREAASGKISVPIERATK